VRIWRRKIEQAQAQLQADVALARSVDELHATVMHGREVRRVADRLREVRAENHFAERIREAYTGGPS
jgi:hypothetical protein